MILLLEMSIRFVLLSFLLAAGSACAQTAQPTAPACEGSMATVRISAITPTGTMDGFLKAAAAHKDWYLSHGMEGHQIFVARILVRDEATRSQRYSDKEAMTYHVLPKTRGPEVKHDESYDAFVKMYRDNSEIKQQYNVCIPSLGLR